MCVRVRWNSSCTVEAGFECKEVDGSEKRASVSSDITGVGVCASAIAYVQFMSMKKMRVCGQARERALRRTRMGTGVEGLSELRQRPCMLSCVDALSCFHALMRTR